ncbi:hypothetical protein MNB_SV-8-1437 [hydrothermal vent metagenome]|uniref:General secretion pathway protein K n=1 Tax=hydrothermal vent metagenome TaxID=652676 RepID=A0A1W1BBF1_9ZZZZ
MDKPTLTISSSVPHKKGFALILTLSVLAVIIALTNVLIGYMDHVRRDATYTKALIQGNLYYADLKGMLERKFKSNRKGLYTQLYQTSIPLASPDGRFSLMIHCRPLANGVNINWLGLGNDQGMQEQYTAALKVFEAIVQRYDLEDATRLQDMILEAIGKPGERFVQPEQSRLRQKNGIISYQQFEAILQRYQFEADDAKVSRVPWKKLFVFNEIKKDKKGKVIRGDKIDGDYLSPELISLFFDIDLATVKEEWKESETKLKTFVQNMGEGDKYSTKLFTKAFLPMTGCEVSYRYGGERFMFTFEDIQKEVKNFEFYGK